MIVLFIVRLSFCHVENQVRQPVSDFHWSIQILKRWKDQSAGKQRAVADCAPASPRVGFRSFIRYDADRAGHSWRSRQTKKRRVMQQQMGSRDGQVNRDQRQSKAAFVIPRWSMVQI